MRIEDIKIGKIELPISRGHRKLAKSTSSTSEEIVIKILTDTGEVGIGSAAVTPCVTGDTVDSMVGAIKLLRRRLIGMRVDSLERIFSVMDQELMYNSAAKSAIDIALYDLLAKKCGLPLYKLLGGYKNKITTDITIGSGTVEEMVNQSIDAQMKGYDHLKIKVGDIGCSEVIERIKAIKRAVKKGTVLRIDADQAWRPKEAVKIIKTLEELDFELDFVEQPVKAWDHEGMQYVTKNVETEILADESVQGLTSAFDIVKDRSADLLNIKLAKCGGIHNAIKIINMAEMVGIKVMVGSMIESKIGITAAASVAAAKKNVIDADLDTVLFFSTDPIEGGVDIDGKDIYLSDEPGLGITDVQGWIEIE